LDYFQPSNEHVWLILAWGIHCSAKLLIHNHDV
jgi:hypothetical protein